MSSTETPTVAVFFHRIGPYHFVRLKAAGQLLNVKAFELSGADESYAWDPVDGAESFERVTIFRGVDSHTRPPSEVSLRVKAALDACRPSVVAISGWGDPGALSALQWCIRSRTPAVMMSESTMSDGRRVPWTEWVKARIVRLCSAGLAGGTPHADYLAKLGIPRERVFMGYDAVDNSHFAAGADDARKRASELRRQHALPERYFLASARFITKKNLVRLIEAYAQYRQRASSVSSIRNQSSFPWSLVLLGDGPLRGTLESQVSTLNLKPYVQMPGFKQYPELPIYYGLAGAFLHASTTEQWGLVVNEAMAAGLPVLVSNHCGCAMDLVRDGVNGFTFDPYDVNQLAELMLRLSQPSTVDSQLSFSAASRKLIADWGPNRFGQGLESAVKGALKVPAPRPRVLDNLLIATLSRRVANTET